MTEWDVKECPDCFGLDEDCKNCDGKGSIEEINTAYDQDQPIGDSPQALYSVGAEPIDAKTGKNFVTVKKLQEDEDRPEHFENVWEKLDSMVKKSSTEKLNKDGTGVKRATRGVNPNRTPHLNLIFVYVSKSDCDICKPHDGMMFPIDSPDRPIIPRLESQGKKGKRPYTHPHCRCKWVAPEISDDDWDLDDLDLIGLKGSARESYSQTKKDIIAIARKQNKNFDSLSKSQQNRIVMNVALRKLTKEVNFDEVKEMYDGVEPITMTEYGKRIDTEGLQKVIKKVVGESLTPKQCVEVEQQHNLDFTYENLLNIIGKKLIVNESKAGELDWKQFGKDLIDIDKVHLDIHDLIEQQKASEAGWDEEDEETVECPNCHGEGHFYHEDEDWQEMCTVCEGMGYIYKEELEASEVEDDLEDEETDWNCRICRGDGYYWDSWYDEDDNYQQMRRECEKCREKYPDFYKSDESLLDKILPTPEQLLARGDLSDPDRKMWEDFLRQEEFDKNNPDPIEDAFNWFKKKFGKETIPVDDMTDDELLNTREYVYGTYKNSEYLGKLDSEITRRGLGDPNYRDERREEDLVNSQYGATENHTANDYRNLWNYNISSQTQQEILDHIGDKGFDYEEDGKMIKLSWAEAEWNGMPSVLQSKIKPYLKSMKSGRISMLESKATEGGVGSGKKGHQKWMRGAYATEECPNCMIRTQKKDGSCELCGHEF